MKVGVVSDQVLDEFVQGLLLFSTLSRFSPFFTQDGPVVKYAPNMLNNSLAYHKDLTKISEFLEVFWLGFHIYFLRKVCLFLSTGRSDVHPPNDRCVLVFHILPN